MKKSIVFPVLEEISNVYEPYFNEDFLKSIKIDDIIYEILQKSINKYIFSILSFTVALTIVENLKNSTQTFHNYSSADKRKVNLFIKYMNAVCGFTNEVNNILEKITTLVER